MTRALRLTVQGWLNLMLSVIGLVVLAGAAGAVGQTTGNRIVVLPNGNLVNFFSVTGAVASNPPSWLGVMTSRDKGVTWSAPVRIACRARSTRIASLALPASLADESMSDPRS